METLTVKTRSRTDLRDITREVADVVANSGVETGAAMISVPHTTAGITVNENADPSVRADIAGALDRMVPWDGPYSHTEGNAAAHVKTTLTGNSTTLPVEGGRPLLGTWQGIYLYEHRSAPHSRRITAHLIGE